MSSRVEGPAHSFRESLRGFRRAAVELIYIFQADEASPFAALSHPLADLDDDLEALLCADTDNDKVAALNKCMSEHVKPLETGEYFAFLRTKAATVIEPFIETVEGLSSSQELDETRQGNYKKFKETVDQTKKCLDDFVSESPPDFAGAAKSLAIVFDKQDWAWSEIEQASRVVVLGCALKKAETGLKAFVPPPILNQDQVKILKLEEKIEKLEQELKEKEERIKGLQAEKMNFRRENITLKNENTELRKQDDEVTKRLRIAQNKVQEVPDMKNTLELCAAVLKSEKRPIPVPS